MAYLVLALLFGLTLGSFGNSVVYRLPRRMQWQWRQAAQEELGLPVDGEPAHLHAARSACPACGHQIAWHDNIPLLSWLVLRGKCRHCAAPISLRYPALEAAGGLIGLASVLWYGFTLEAVAVAVAAMLLLWASVIDAEHQLLPEALVVPLLTLGLLSSTQGWFVSPSEAIWGATVGWLALTVPAWLYRLLRGEDGVGAGDATLLAALGSFLGVPATLYCLALAGALCLTWMLVRSVGKPHLWSGRRFPFGPWLALAGAVLFCTNALGLWQH